MPEPFSAEEVIELCDKLKDQPAFQQRNGVMENWYQLLHRDALVNITGVSMKLEHRSPVLAVHNDLYRNRMASAEFRASVASRRSGDTYVKQAQGVEGLTYYLWHDFMRNPAHERALDFQTWAGIGFRHVSWSPQVRRILLGGQKTDTVDDMAKVLDKVLKDGFLGNPFVLEAPEPRAVFYDLDRSLVAEVGDRTVSSIVTSYKDLTFTKEEGFLYLTSDTIERGRASQHWQEVATFYRLETEEHTYECVKYTGGGQRGDQAFLLDRLPNLARAQSAEYARPRYSFAEGHLTSAREPEYQHRPLIHSLYPVVAELNAIRTLLASGALMTGRPLIQEVKIGTAADDDFSLVLREAGQGIRTIKVDFGEGMLQQPRPGYEYRPMLIPAAEHLVITLGQLERDKNEFGFPLAINPQAPLSATAGYDRHLQQQAAGDSLEPPLKHLAAACLETTKQCFDQLRELGLPITFLLKQQRDGKAVQVPTTIKPDFFEDLDVEIGFDSIPDTVAYAQHEDMRRDVAEGYTAPTTYMATLHDDPIAEMEKRDLDLVAIDARNTAIEDVKQIAASLRGEIAVQLAVKHNIPLPQGKQRQNGGTSMEMTGNRAARPASGGFPGEGAPMTPPMQDEMMGGGGGSQGGAVG